MFGLSVEHLLILLVAGLFILGPERLPGAAAWLGTAVRKARDYATSARHQINTELGPEFDELRKPLQELSELRVVNPRTAVTRYLLDEPSAPPSTPGTAAPVGTVQPPVLAGAEPGLGSNVDMEAT
jgi:sec-independent protein translocase protein TatB